MGLFKKRIPDPSKLRQWANNDLAEKKSGRQKKRRWVKLLSDSIIWAVTRFGDRSRNEDFPTQYSDDFAVFEWACYAYYRIACWHHDHNIHEDQDAVLGLLVHTFAERFEKETGVTGVLDIMTNRFDHYCNLEEQGKPDSILFHIEQLIKKSTSEQSLQPCSDDEPVIISDVFASFSLKTSIMASDKAMIPAMIGSVEKFYELVE